MHNLAALCFEKLTNIQTLVSGNQSGCVQKPLWYLPRSINIPGTIRVTAEVMSVGYSDE